MVLYQLKYCVQAGSSSLYVDVKQLERLPQVAVRLFPSLRQFLYEEMLERSIFHPEASLGSRLVHSYFQNDKWVDQSIGISIFNSVNTTKWRRPSLDGFRDPGYDIASSVNFCFAFGTSFQPVPVEGYPHFHSMFSKDYLMQFWATLDICLFLMHSCYDKFSVIVYLYFYQIFHLWLAHHRDIDEFTKHLAGSLRRSTSHSELGSSRGL